jgi:cytochrome b6-f complex iron-sulfur subunit
VNIKQENKLSRRNFLGMLSSASVVVMGLFIGFIGGKFLYPIKKKKPLPLFICLESQVPNDMPLDIMDPDGRKVLLIKKSSTELLAIGTICSHLGCTVFYRPAEKKFECPCHQGVFDGEGNPVSGPPQRPLTHYPTEVRDGKVFVQFG